MSQTRRQDCDGFVFRSWVKVKGKGVPLGFVNTAQATDGLWLLEAVH